MHWLADVPIYIAQTAAKLLPQLDARGVLHDIDAIALGTGSYPEHHAKRVRSAYLRAANSGLSVRQSDPRPAPTIKEMAWLKG